MSETSPVLQYHARDRRIRWVRWGMVSLSLALLGLAGYWTYPLFEARADMLEAQQQCLEFTFSGNPNDSINAQAYFNYFLMQWGQPQRRGAPSFLHERKTAATRRLVVIHLKYNHSVYVTGRAAYLGNVMIIEPGAWLAHPRVVRDEAIDLPLPRFRCTLGDGQPDPNDESRFTFSVYGQKGERLGTVICWLREDDTVGTKFEPISASATSSSTSPARP